MAVLKIKYANGKTAAFTINGELYYIKVGPDYPQLFNRAMTKLIIPNVDSWLQAQTQQRYSFRGLCDMIESFCDGLQHSYAKDDLRQICEHIYEVTRDYIFKTEYSRLYATTFRVELMNQKQVSTLIAKIKDNFDVYRQNLGDNKLYNYLCRIWQFCNFYEPGESAVVATIIKRLDREAAEPTYPTVPDETTVKKHIITRTLGDGLSKYKGIDEIVVRHVHQIEGGLS